MFSLNRLFKRRKVKKLRWKFLFYMILLIIVLMGGVFIVVERNDRSVFIEEWRKRGLAAARHLASVSIAPLFMYDYTKLEQNIDEVVKEPDVIYAMVLDKKGMVLIHSHSNELVGKILDDPLSMTAADSEYGLIQEQVIQETGEEIWDIAYPIVPIGETRWGTVRVGISKENLEKEIVRNRRDLAFLSLGAIFLAGAAALFLSEKISGPIRKLTNGVRSITEGNLNQEISIHTGDEIQELSETFNNMIKELLKNRDELKQLIRQLSTKNRLLKKEITKRKELESELINIERLRALGQMAGGVAHDFNNVLGAILGRAQLLLETVEDPALRRGMQIIEKAALDGAETVRRIQEFTRVRVDKKLFVPMTLNEVIRDAIEYTKSCWKSQEEAIGVCIEVNPELGEIPKMMGDPAGLREVFTNLIINAVDAMPDGGTITITTFCDQNMAVIEIADTGIGMSERVRKKIFDPFFTTKGKRGSGLGLSICYGIISRHKGEITIKSKKGEGSTFIIRIPLNLPGREKAAPPTVVKELPPAKILVIDDEDIIRELLSDMLVKAGCHVDGAASGDEGLELFSLGDYDIVFTDLGMEGVSGWEVARVVKATSPFTPVALITGWGIQLDEEKIRSRGVDFIVSKPFRLEELKAVVSQAMLYREENRN